MTARTRTRFWIETALAVLSACLLCATLFDREWIEVVFRVDLDHGTGALEALTSVGLLAATIGLAVTARLERRNARADAPGGRHTRAGPLRDL